MLITFTFAVIFVIGMLCILAVAGFVYFYVFKSSSRASPDTNRDRNESGRDGRRRALEILVKRPPQAAAYKCGKCGATVDSTAELSADGKVRCNYCNEWSSIL